MLDDLLEKMEVVRGLPEACTEFRQYLMAVIEMLRELKAQAVEAAEKVAAEQKAAVKELMPRTNRKAKRMPKL